VVKIYNIFF